jgi:hypothetical protein
MSDSIFYDFIDAAKIHIIHQKNNVEKLCNTNYQQNLMKAKNGVFLRCKKIEW